MRLQGDMRGSGGGAELNHLLRHKPHAVLIIPNKLEGLPKEGGEGLPCPKGRVVRGKGEGRDPGKAEARVPLLQRSPEELAVLDLLRKGLQT